MSEITQLAKEYKSDQEIRWCPGCGDIAVLNAIQRTLPMLGRKREDFAFVSGIGCSSRFPYYMNTYGIHGIHGRAMAIASGTKVANPNLSVWVITGDGDSMAIGGNHFIHVIRRNIDLNIILLNNQIYGLTKGQYSPTSQYGQITKTSPFGTIENPFNPGNLAIGSGSRFFSRTIDTYVKESIEVYKEAELHKGTSVVEVLQNCIIYNDKAHAAFTDKNVREDMQVWLKHGEPMIFGKNRDRILTLKNNTIKVALIGEHGITEKDALIHDAKDKNVAIHIQLVNMRPEDGLPIAMGVIRSVDDMTYSDKVVEQIKEVKAQSKIKCMDDLMRSGSTWEVE